MERVLTEYGWTPEVRAASDSFAIYVHPLKPGYKVPVNPEWERFYAGDGTFNSLQRDIGISPEELARRLSGHDD